MGDRPQVTIRDVAKTAGVSISTVSRFLNNSGYVDKNTGARIADAMSATSYSPSIAARSLKTQKSRVILLVVPDICNPFYSTIAKTVQRLVRERGYVMALYDSDESLEELSSVGIARQMYASGILMGSIDIKPEVIAALLDSEIPVVGLNAYSQYPFDTVHVKGSDGSYLAARHLVSLGHRDIGFAGGSPNSMIGRSRLTGYLRALDEARIMPAPDRIIEMGFSQADGRQAGLRFAEMSPKPTAICCANDQIALGLLQVLHARGIAVPGEISVTGMDDISYAETSNPSLTSVTNDGTAFSREGVAMLFDRITCAYAGAPRNVSIEHTLIVRASTCPPRGPNV